MTNYGKLHNSLQDHFGRIEESGRSMRKLSLLFPVMNQDILDELKTLKRRVDKLITAFETIEQDDEHPMRF